jgi:hypothetical protein
LSRCNCIPSVPALLIQLSLPGYRPSAAFRLARACARVASCCGVRFDGWELSVPGGICGTLRAGTGGGVP